MSVSHPNGSGWGGQAAVILRADLQPIHLDHRCRVTK
jgi:hypothetical protein